MRNKTDLKTIIILGIMSMSIQSVSAAALKPSQLNSLNSVMNKVNETEQWVIQEFVTDDVEAIKARIRELTRAQKSLARMAKSLQRLPDNTDVEAGLKTIEMLDGLVAKQLQSIQDKQASLASNQVAEQASFQAMLASSKTQSDIARMEELTTSFRVLAVYLSSSEGHLTHSIYKSLNQESINEAIELLKKADDMVIESNQLNKQYVQYTLQSGAVSLSSKLRDLMTNQQRYQAIKPEFIELFPAVQISAVQVLKNQLDEIMKTHYNRDMFSENSSNKTAIQLDKARVLVQASVFAAVVGSKAAEVIKMKDDSMAYWEQVKNETDYDIYLKSKEDQHNKSWLTDDASTKNK